MSCLRAIPCCPISGAWNILKRAGYYVCRKISEQGYKGYLDPSVPDASPKDGANGSDDRKYWDYGVVPVVGVFFTNFFVSGLERKVLTKGRMMDEETHRPVGDDIRLVFIQLPAFNKTEGECVRLFDQWMYNLIHMDSMDTMKFTSHQDIFKRLDRVASYATLTPDERRQYDYDLKRARDYHAEIAYARKEAIKEGRAEGRAEAIAEKIKTAREMGLSDDVISRLFGVN